VAPTRYSRTSDARGHLWPELLHEAGDEEDDLHGGPEVVLGSGGRTRRATGEDLSSGRRRGAAEEDYDIF